MDLMLNEEQLLLRDSAVKFMEQRAGTDLVRRVRDSEIPFDAAVWRDMADAGWLAIMVPEEMGGLGLGMTELALVLEEAGKSLMPGPLVAAAAAAKIVAEGANAAERQALIDGLIGGEVVIVPALQETPFDLDPATTNCRAEPDGDNLRLTGQKMFIPEAGAADGFLVNALGPDGLTICYIAADAEGVEVDLTGSVDGGDTGALTFKNAVVPPAHVVAGPNQAAEAAAQLNDLTFIGLSAELLGVMECALDTSVEYIKIRSQFDQPIGKFQALQHRAVNDYVDIELTRSLLYQAAAMADRDEYISATASALKAKASGAALTVTKSAIQFHGAIGVSDEHDIGLYFKRAIALSTYYGNEMAHRRRYAALSGLEPAG